MFHPPLEFKNICRKLEIYANLTDNEVKENNDDDDDDDGDCNIDDLTQLCAQM